MTMVRTVFDKQSKHLFKLMVTNQKTYRGCFVYQSNFRRLEKSAQAATLLFTNFVSDDDDLPIFNQLSVAGSPFHLE